MGLWDVMTSWTQEVSAEITICPFAASFGIESQAFMRPVSSSSRPSYAWIFVSFSS
jgi:hypothetical protein